MKPTELRIGNLFDFSYSQDGYLAVEEIRKENEGFKGHYAVFRNGSIKVLIEEDCLYPIPLTEEWLLKFGFEQPYIELTTKEFVKGDLIIYLYKPVNREWYYGSWREGKIKYVHQLQNLYFALTGEELTIK